jgi:hypothetical protein
MEEHPQRGTRGRTECPGRRRLKDADRCRAAVVRRAVALTLVLLAASLVRTTPQAASQQGAAPRPAPVGGANFDYNHCGIPADYVALTTQIRPSRGPNLSSATERH